MKQFSQQFYKKATTTVKLQAAEKRELRERLVSYMEYHPLPAGMKSRKAFEKGSSVKTEAFKVVSIPFHALFKYGVAASVVILVLVPFVAERAVPGDALYAIKVQFNEELRSTLTFDGFQKVEWETERLNRRLAEARLLADEGRLTEAVEIEVAEAVRFHTDNVKRVIEELRETDADDATIAAIALDTTLEAQSATLKADQETAELTIDGTGDVSPQSSGLIASAIDESREKSTEAGATSTVPAYDKLIARVEQNTTRLYELRTTFTDSVPEMDLSDIDRRIEDIERAIDAAAVLLQSDELEARKNLVDVLQRTQRLIVFMSGLNAAETMDIETLVPVVLTEEEKQADITSSIADLTVKKELIATLIAGSQGSVVEEKVAVGETMVSDLLQRMSSSTEDYETFIILSSEAKAVADDTISLLEQYYTAEELIHIRANSHKSDEEDLSEELSEEVASTTAATNTEAQLPEGEENGEPIEDAGSI